MQDDLKERLRRIVKKPYSARRGPPPCELQMLDRIAALEAKLAEKDAQLAEALAENARLLASVKGWAADAARLNDNADYWRQKCHRLRETLAGEQPWN
jgi:hypothetical protein